MPNTIRLRRGTASQWSAANTVLSDGEPGFETDTNKFKIGAGTASWNDLPYTAIDPATASSLYATITDVESNYLPISASSNYLFIDAASATYLTQSDASNIYLSQGSASATYLRQDSASATYSAIDSPTFIGTPLAPTAASGTNTTQIATTAYVDSALGNIQVEPTIHPMFIIGGV
jgi:hypothetical protein